MTRATSPRSQRLAKSTNPLAHISFQVSDLSGIEARGGGSKELVEVTPELRSLL